jgi:hypothetical protein
VPTAVHPPRRPFVRAITAALGAAIALAFAAPVASASASVTSCIPNCPPVVGSAYGIVHDVLGNYVINDDYNSRHQVDSVVNDAPGAYLVTLPGLTAAGGTVNVTGMSSNCIVLGWTASQATGTVVDVRCYDYQANPVNDDFAFTFTSQRQNNFPYAYALVDDAWSTTSTPNLTYQFDQGSTITVKHTKLGVYTVNIPFSGYGPGGTAKATAYDQDASCEVVDLNGNSSTEKATVKCAGVAGPVNTQFTITFLRGTDLLDQKTLASGYARLDPPAATGTFAATGNYWTWESPGGVIDAYKSQTGLYFVHFPGIATPGNAQVATIGSKANRCRLVDISATAGNTTVEVVCAKMNAPTKFVDSPFLVQVTSIS